MTKRRAIIVAAAVVVVVCVVALSVARIAEVNSSFNAMVVADASGVNAESDTSSASVGLTILEYAEGELIPMEGLTVEGKTVPSGISCSASNARIETEKEIMDAYDWSGVPAGGAYQRYDAPLFLLADVTIQNSGDTSFHPVWFDLEAGSWSTVRELSLMYVLNGLDDAAEFDVEPGESRVFTIAYMLWEPTFSAQQWSNVENLEYSLTFLDYPTKIIVRIQQGR